MIDVKDFFPTIQQDYVSVFASGNSILSIPMEDLNLIKSKSFMIGINYAVTYLRPHFLLWSDKVVTEFLAAHFSQNPINEILCAREAAFNQNVPAQVEFKQKVFWGFDKNKNGLDGNYTVVWVLQLLKKYLPPNKKILVFGLDMKLSDKDKDAYKFYDKFTKYDAVHRGRSFPAMEKLKECAQQLDQIRDKTNIINCNLESAYDGFPKEDFKNYLK
jgi:hypothetical protein